MRFRTNPKCEAGGRWHRFFHDCQLDMISGRGLAVVASVIIVGVIAIVGAVAVAVDQAQCRTIATQTGLPTRWTLLAGCFVEQDGQWLPYDRWVNVHQVP